MERNHRHPLSIDEFLEIECVGHVSSVQDKVKRECPGLGPVFVLGANEFFGTESERIFLLIGSVGDSVRFSTERRGPKETKLAKTAAERAKGVNVCNELEELFHLIY